MTSKLLTITNIITNKNTNKNIKEEEKNTKKTNRKEKRRIKEKTKYWNRDWNKYLCFLFTFGVGKLKDLCYIKTTIKNLKNKKRNIYHLYTVIYLYIQLGNSNLLLFLCVSVSGIIIAKVCLNIYGGYKNEENRKTYVKRRRSNS